MRAVALFLGVLSLAVAAHADPVLWTLEDVELSDGGTASGSFVFDADSTTACSTGSSPCGTFSDVDIVTTAGTTLPGAVYDFVCAETVSSCTGLEPDSTQVLFLTSDAANQSGDTGLALYFTLHEGPPAGLSDVGGVIDIGGMEATCIDSACSVGVAPERDLISGEVVSPEPAAWLLSMPGLCLILCIMSIRNRTTAAGISRIGSAAAHAEKKAPFPALPFLNTPWGPCTPFSKRRPNCARTASPSNSDNRPSPMAS